MPSGLRSDERGGLATDPPRPIHRTSYVAFKKLRILMENCGEALPCVNHMSLSKGSGTASNKLGSIFSKHLAGYVSTFLFSDSQNRIWSYVPM